MGAWNNPVIIPAPAYRPSVWESTIAPTLTSVLGNLALAKMQHNWRMDIADKQLQAQQIAAQQEMQYKEQREAVKSKQKTAQELKQKGFEPITINDGEIAEETLQENQPAAGIYKDVHGQLWQRPKLPPGQSWRGVQVIKEPEQKQGKYDKNLYVAAQIAGIPVEKVESGKLTSGEADLLADAYREKFGAEGLMQMLFKGSANMPTMAFDAQGNRIK